MVEQKQLKTKFFEKLFSEELCSSMCLCRYRGPGFNAHFSDYTFINIAEITEKVRLAKRAPKSPRLVELLREVLVARVNGKRLTA